ncbi:hypothetical protein [Eisenbergiella sp.]
MLTQVQKLQLKNAVQRVLHVPGNYRGGPIEMAVVADYSADREAVAECGKEIVAVLKSMGDTFRNVRLNLVRWKADDDIKHEISALAYLQTGRAFQDYEPSAARKRLELLCGQLKMFQARSRLLLLITDGDLIIEDEALLRENLNPFLYRKLILIMPEGIKPGSSLLQDNE